ncbi:CBS domain-containing protein [Marinobacter sp. X15-166B]|uniref:CBS domain-containing protein n=1 Tax=Marinobacter sp. X15-166B TaxID=1897620 RepID=UPI001D171A82|nr:CBS domain-containing protein [Marinobacter sp. X15-166B]
MGVARALAADPNILLMDEPFGALDAITRESLQKEMLKLQRQIRKTTVFVTHDIDEAMKLADRIAVMDAGRIVQHDTPENILRQPASEFVENLFGSQERGLKVAALKGVVDVMSYLEVPCQPDVGAVSIGEADSLRHALSLMLWQKTDHLPVVDEAGQQTGVLTLDQVREGAAG